MELVSIIVPIYNVEAFLDRCVSSLVNQAYRDLEIILVDDGSPDNCGVMCDEWAKKDDRIQVIHKPNGGLSDARNAGLSIATGSLIAFVDSDDWVSPLFIEQLYQAIRIGNYDIVECSIVRTEGEEPKFGATSVKTVAYTASAALEQLIRDDVFHQYVWNKLYRREVVEEIFFEKGKTNEDEFWTYQVFGRATKVGRLNSTLYYYYQRPDSIMGAQYSIKRLDALAAKQQRQRYIGQRFPTLAGLAKVNLFGSCIYSGQMTLKCLRGDEQRRAREIIDRIQSTNHPATAERAILSGTEKLWMELACMSFWGTCRIKNLLNKGF